MGTTYYYTVNDEIIAEHTLGQSRLDYLTDGIGSVIATIDQTLTVQSTARYKPFGAILASTGTQPRFGWVGSHGYRQTGLPHSDVYVRRRHPDTTEGRWTTVDPLWPGLSAYVYSGSNPVSFIDPSGYLPQGKASPHGTPTCICVPTAHAVNVPGSGLFMHPMPQAGIPIGSCPLTRQWCYDSACQSYCIYQKYWDDQRTAVGMAGSFSSKAKASNDKYPPCQKGNPFWDECATPDANKSCWPRPQYQTNTLWTRDLFGWGTYLGGEYCDVEALVRLCCAEGAAMKKRRKQLASDFADCNKSFKST